ncbi:MAG: hypothetical protein KGI45_00785 [Patescibacteria group bacterium]|nr:hypothetical protein [Patescibacteria group bacterium]MDE1941325.1 hypothetical protein [Patescibacteria group bacterium]MDE1966594.1 hypothetical protein [Patescibacteria group bacterium]
MKMSDIGDPATVALVSIAAALLARVVYQWVRNSFRVCPNCFGHHIDRTSERRLHISRSGRYSVDCTTVIVCRNKGPCANKYKEVVTDSYIKPVDPSNPLHLFRHLRYRHILEKGESRVALASRRF